MGEPMVVAHYFMEFLVVDHWPVYHGVLVNTALKELWAVTSIHHLYMKFPIEKGIATVWGNQMESKECYLNSLWKAKSQSINLLIIDIEMSDVLEKGPTPNKEKTLKYWRPLKKGSYKVS